MKKLTRKQDFTIPIFFIFSKMNRSILSFSNAILFDVDLVKNKLLTSLKDPYMVKKMLSSMPGNWLLVLVCIS